MAPSIGVNLRVTGQCNQGGRKYMEDTFAVAYQQTDDESDLEYAYFGIFDGHGGREAAIFAKEHLMNFIVGQKGFWSDEDENVLKAIKDGFVAAHMAMWKQVGNWPQTVSGLPSTSGTTASVVFIRKGKMYIGHVGDSAIVLGYKEPDSKHYMAQPLTKDHKPESPMEKKRIEEVGGSVINKSGVQRVVWNRPRIGHKGPIRRSTQIDQIPFLAVARSLGDLWSYDYYYEQFIVSPEPDVSVVTIDPKRDRCIILATDGLWNMLSPKETVQIIEAAEQENERHFLNNVSLQIGCKPWVNPSRLLVEHALQLWALRKKRADNTTVVTVMLDPPGPPKSEVLLRRRMLLKLRPREEPEAGPSSERDWWEPRSRVMVNHEPSSHFTADDCGTRPMWQPEYGTPPPRLHPPPLPPKSKHYARQHSSTLSGRGNDKWNNRQDVGSTTTVPSTIYASDPSVPRSSCGAPPTTPSRSFLPPPMKIAETDLNQELLRSAPTPPLPCTNDVAAVPLGCKASTPTGTCPRPASLQRICRMSWDRGHNTGTDLSTKCVNPASRQQQDDRVVSSTALKDENSVTTSVDIKLGLATTTTSTTSIQTNDAKGDKGHTTNTYQEEDAQFSCKTIHLDNGETVAGLKRKLSSSRRELLTPLAKHARVSHNRSSTWSSSLCRPVDCVSEHVTRSRIRLRKAQA